MKEIANLERFNEPIMKMGEMILDTVNKAIPESQWKCARFSDRGGFSKLKVAEMSDGSRKGVKASNKRRVLRFGR